MSASRCIVMFGYICQGTVQDTRTLSAAEITPAVSDPQATQPWWSTLPNYPLGVVHITSSLAGDNIVGFKFRYTKLSYPQ